MPGDDEVAVRAARDEPAPAPDHFAPVPDDLHPESRTAPPSASSPLPGLRFLGPRARAWWTAQPARSADRTGRDDRPSEWYRSGSGLVSQYGVNFPHEVARRPSLLSESGDTGTPSTILSIAQYGYAGKAVGHGQALGDIAFAPSTRRASVSFTP